MRPEEARGSVAEDYRIPYREGDERAIPYRAGGVQQIRHREEGERQIPFRREGYTGLVAPSVFETVSAAIGRSLLLALGIAIVAGFAVGFVLRKRAG